MKNEATQDIWILFRMNDDCYSGIEKTGFKVNYWTGYLKFSY